MSDRERLVASFLDGEAAPEERQALLGGLRSDPAFAREVAGLLVTERLLRLHGSDDEAFAREVLERLRASGGPALSPGVIRRLGRRPAWGWVVGAAAAVVIGVMTVLIFRAATEEPAAKRKELPPAARVVRSEGAVYVVRPTGSMPAREGESLDMGDRVETRERGQVEIRYQDGTNLKLGAGSSVSGFIRAIYEGHSLRAGLHCRLDRGTLEADVRPQRSDSPFGIVTPHGEVTVVGTRFRLDVRASNTLVEVTQGHVRATRADRATAEVGEGQFAVVEPGMDLVARPVRVGSGIVALYRVREAEGGRVRDVSGHEPALDFTMRDAGGKPMAEPWKIGRGATATFAVPPARLVEAARKSRAITIEMWLQREGEAATTHVARTFDASGVVRVYADGAAKAQQRMPLDLASWDGDFRTLLADDVARQWPWPGEYHLLAIYDRVLSAEEVRRNFESGRPR